MERKNGKISYCIYEFMNDFGLKNSELKVYAFIYAYDKSDFGLYFGRRSLIAERCGVSVRTVHRAIPRLKKLGLIEDAEITGVRGLRCVKQRIPKDECESPEDSLQKEKKADELPRDLPKYSSVSVGKGYFSMTREQIGVLLKLISREEFENYVIRMEKMLEANDATGIPAPHSFYRTIKKWIHEDFSV